MLKWWLSLGWETRGNVIAFVGFFGFGMLSLTFWMMLANMLEAKYFFLTALLAITAVVLLVVVTPLQ